MFATVLDLEGLGNLGRSGVLSTMQNVGMAEDRRFQVFVSSTFLDLQEERAAVVSALLQMEAFPAGMELFPAADDDAWTLIKRVIDSSDYYLLVIGGRYGSVDPETELSYTEMEFDYAVDEGKPVLAFLHQDMDKIEMGKSEKDPDLQKKLNEFREKVEKTKHVKYWKGPENLAGQVALSYANFRQSYPAVGWIRGDVRASIDAIEEINDLNKKLTEAEKAIASERFRPPDGSDDLSQGDEEVSLTIQYSADVSSDILTIKTYRGTVSHDVTWNEIFSTVGPYLLDEADDGSLKEKLDEMLSDLMFSDIKDRLDRHLEKKGVVATGIRWTKVTLSPEDFGTIIVQFRALGLIEKSERNRSVKDTSTYWCITPLGDEHLTSLRAIRRGDAESTKTDEPENLTEVVEGSE